MSRATPERRHEAAMKAGATLRAHKEAERERERTRRADRENALTICRQIRDNPDAADADRLEAIKMIANITNQ